MNGFMRKTYSGCGTHSLDLQKLCSALETLRLFLSATLPAHSKFGEDRCPECLLAVRLVRAKTMLYPVITSDYVSVRIRSLTAVKEVYYGIRRVLFEP